VRYNIIKRDRDTLTVLISDLGKPVALQYIKESELKGLELLSNKQLQAIKYKYKVFK